MALLVFMRAANVGKHNRFRPAALAAELSAFEVVNIGAAGTFVVRKKVSQTRLRAELVRRLPVKTDFMICAARDLVRLMSEDPFAREGFFKDARRFISLLRRRPSSPPRFPSSHPAGKAWQVKLLGLHARFVLSLWRPARRAMVYPNEVVERELGVQATTRNLDTMSRIHEILGGG